MNAGVYYPCSLMNLAWEQLLQTAVVVLLLCLVLFIVSILSEVLLQTECLFVNSFLRSVGGGGSACYLSARNTWTHPSNVLLS